MTAPLRLIAEPEADQRTVRFSVEFPAPAPEAAADCAPVSLFTGDPQTGEPRSKIVEHPLCAPTAITWRAAHRVELGAYTYASPGVHTASLRWGDVILSTDIDLDQPAAGQNPVLPTLPVLAIKPGPEASSQAVVRVEVLGLQPGQQVRVDAGAGHIFPLLAAEGADQSGEWTVDYSKSGEYPIFVDLLDQEGYWLASLGEGAATLSPEPVAVIEPLAEPLPSLADSADWAIASAPWLPHSYVRPAWGGVRTYSAPGGGSVVRSLVLGTYLAIQRDMMAGGQLWHQSVQGDWVPASSVIPVTPSDLRGVELGAAPPPPPPPPPPGDVRHGVVTASLLNVRARPGVAANNPPIAQLPYGAAVTIYSEQLADGILWYRIGDSRWVHSGWVRIVQDPPPPTVRYGRVTAEVLNVRARPGVSPDNPVVGQLTRGANVTIYEERTVSGAVWYRIGDNRWVHSAWIQLVDAPAADLSLAMRAPDSRALPVGWVTASALNVRARPGVSPDNPPIDEVLHNTSLDILETRLVSGAAWYRIGDNRWVFGQSVAAAKAKARPAGIGAGEYWVGVNLAHQTAVAYQGDRPVYAAMVATGMPATPTVQGVFRTWQRLATGRMAGGSAATGGYYYLEGVTWTCYFYAGYALHTAYWHDAFGRPRSHGCVNFSPYDAWWIYQWSAAGGARSPAVYVYAS